MKIPKKTKFRKNFKIHTDNVPNACSNNKLVFGDIGLKAMESSRITAAQIEAARSAVVRHMERKGRLFIRIFPHFPVTIKGLGVRMGSGKGHVDYWAALVRPGVILFELDTFGISEAVAKECLKIAAHKLSFKTTIVSRQDNL